MTTSSVPSEVDLAFIIDATGSMGSYIHAAQTHMKSIIHEIITSEKCLLNVALVLYRDHPPQDSSFIIQVYNFTDDAEEAKKHIDGASASGGGDGPEAVAPALHAAVHTLTWRKNAVKVALLIADAPPHGLDIAGDGFPQGDPSGHDPIECVARLAENAVTLYTIGCEPAATPYRDFYMALAFKTGGQYIPLSSGFNLASVIVGSTREEISLERLLAQVHEEVMQEAAARGGPVDETELTRRIHEVMQGGGAKARRVRLSDQPGASSIPALTTVAEELSKLTTLDEVRQQWRRFTGAAIVSTPATSTTGGLFGLACVRKAPPTRHRPAKTATIKKKAPVKRKATPTVAPIIKKKARKAVVPSRGKRRSARLALDVSGAEKDESSADEAMDTTTVAPTPPKPAPKKPTPMKKEVSDIVLEEDELLDISQTRRLVRKCVARSQLKST